MRSSTSCFMFLKTFHPLTFLWWDLQRQLSNSRSLKPLRRHTLLSDKETKPTISDLWPKKPNKIQSSRPPCSKTQINPVHRKPSFIAQMNLFPIWVFSVDAKCRSESKLGWSFLTPALKLLKNPNTRMTRKVLCCLLQRVQVQGFLSSGDIINPTFQTQN
jgi:hypothetical protein